MLGRSSRTILWAAAAGAMSLLAAAVSLRLTTDALGLPWGRGTWSTGDAALMYMATSTMVRFGWITQNPDVGFPGGMDLAHIPFAEIHQWVVLRGVAVFTDNPILALNVLFLFGFFAVGFASFLLFHATVGTRWLALALAVTLATLPWHYARFHHTLLADYSPVPIILLLAYRMWTDSWASSRWNLALALFGSLYLGTAGVYYSFFACLILGPVLLWRIAAVRRPTRWWRDTLVVATVPLAMTASLFAHQSLASQELPGTSLVDRMPIMSLWFAGLAPSLLSPWPFYDSELEGAAQFSVIVVLAFVISVVALIVFSLAALRGRRGPTFLRLHGALRPWFMLLIWTLAWYVPGLGWLFAVAITPEIRSWGRLSVVVAYIASVVAGMLIAEFVQGSRKRTGLVATALAVLLGWQFAQDHRAVVIPARSSELHAAGSSYAEGIRQVLPDGCPVLQLPALRFPEEWREEWEDAGMSAYDHMWVHLYAPEFQWTFGAPRGSQGDAEAQSRYAEVPISDQLENARMDGFCAVHVDSLGLGIREEAEVRGLLGEPVVDEGRWALYLLDGLSREEPEG